MRHLGIEASIIKMITETLWIRVSGQTRFTLGQRIKFKHDPRSLMAILFAKNEFMSVRNEKYSSSEFFTSRECQNIDRVMLI